MFKGLFLSISFKFISHFLNLVFQRKDFIFHSFKSPLETLQILFLSSCETQKWIQHINIE